MGRDAVCGRDAGRCFGHAGWQVVCGRGSARAGACACDLGGGGGDAVSGRDAGRPAVC